MKHLKLFEEELSDFTKDLFGLTSTIYVSFLTSSIVVSQIIMDELEGILSKVSPCKVEKEKRRESSWYDYIIHVEGMLTYETLVSLFPNPTKEDLARDYDTIKITLEYIDKKTNRSFKIGWTKQSGIFRMG